MRRILPILAALALAACHPQGQDAASAGPPAAETSAGLTAGAASAHKAADAFLTVAGDFTHTGKLPHADDPSVKPLVDAVFDTSALPTDPVPMSQLADINDWLVSVSKVGRAYVLAGTGAARDDDPTGPVIEAQFEKNFAAFSPELGRYLDTQDALMTLEAASIARQMVDDPDLSSSPGGPKQLGLVRVGLTKSITAMLGILGTALPSDDWRRARMPYLMAMTTQAAKLNTPADLAAIRASVTALAQASDDITIRADLAEMAKTLGAAPS